MSTTKRNWTPLIILLIAVVVVWIISILMVGIFYNDLGRRGLFGDSFGFINSLFSGLAFAGLIYTIFQQREDLNAQTKSIELQTKEMSLQAEQLALQKEELEGTKKEIKIQNETLKRQRFENTFFQLLSLYQEIINNLSTPERKFTKRAAIHHYTDRMILQLEKNIKTDRLNNTYTIDKVTNQIRFQLRTMDANSLNIFDNYFQILINIYRTVHTTTFLTIIQKHEYINILQSLYTKNEIRLLFIKALSNEDTYNQLMFFHRTYGLFTVMITTKTFHLYEELYVALLAKVKDPYLNPNPS